MFNRIKLSQALPHPDRFLHRLTKEDIMKAISLKQPGQFEAIEIDAPAAPGPGQVLVKTHRMGICGTDISGFLGKMPFFSYPRIPGHELGVEVVAVGEGVTNVVVGDRCSVEPYLNCGECFACRKAASNCCAKLNEIVAPFNSWILKQL